MSTTTEKLGLTKMELTDTMADWMTAHNGNMEIIDGILGLAYPVGSIYMSVNNVSPAALFGGTWEAIGGKFLLGANDSHPANETGGSESKTIGVTNLPSHTHGLNSHKHTVGAHAHGLNSHTHSVGAHSHGLNSHTHSYSAPANHTHGVSGAALLGNSSTAGSLKLNCAQMVAISGVSNKRLTLSGLSQQSGPVSVYESWYDENHSMTLGVGVTGTANSGGGSSAATTGQASGSTANSTAFNSGQATGNTANSTAFESGAATGDTAATGGGNALNIMPPYLSVYMWKRTA